MKNLRLKAARAALDMSQAELAKPSSNPTTDFSDSGVNFAIRQLSKLLTYSFLSTTIVLVLWY